MFFRDISAQLRFSFVQEGIMDHLYGVLIPVFFDMLHAL